jgi:hypothetical protein
MRYLFGFLYVSVLGLVPMVGCNEPGSLQDGDSTSCLRPLDDYCGGSGCPSSLGEYCGGSTCPTYEQALTAAENLVEEMRGYCETCGPFPARFDAGRCGDLRYVREDCGDDYTEFFDASGTLVAAYLWSDQWGFACWNSWAGYFGFRPECELEQEQNFCEVPCYRRLDEYCEGSGCPTYEQALAAAEEFARLNGCGCAEVWRCGDSRYVDIGCREVSNLQFFDASGTLVAVGTAVECGSVCPGACYVQYGIAPECAEWELEQDFCDQHD